MTRRYLAFDLEIAALIPDDAQDWKQYRPLGITCAAIAWHGDDGIETQTFHGNATGELWSDATPAPRMTAIECRDLVKDLRYLAQKGHTILTWNGLSFDFDILAEESGTHAECAELATNHVDMMFQVFCTRGYPLGLDTVAKGLGLSGKVEGMSGALAPQLWADGKYEQVLEYVAQDVRTTLEVALAVEKRGGFSWIAKSGRRNSLDIKRWLTVKECLKLPESDNSWMSDPIPRERFTSWMAKEVT